MYIVSLGELRSVQSVSATVNLMQSYCSRLLIFHYVVLFFQPWCSFVPTQQVNGEAFKVISHFFHSPNPTTSKQQPNNAMAMQGGLMCSANVPKNKRHFRECMSGLPR